MSTTDPRPTSAQFEYLGHEPWMQKAACVGHPPEWWHSETVGPRQDENEAAKRICGGCPVQTACLAYAMRTETTDWGRYGIWGGLAPDERRQLSRGDVA